MRRDARAPEPMHPVSSSIFSTSASPVGSPPRDVSVGLGSLILGDLITAPREALELTLPLWLKILGLVAANVLGVQAGGVTMLVV